MSTFFSLQDSLPPRRAHRRVPRPDRDDRRRRPPLLLAHGPHRVVHTLGRARGRRRRPAGRRGRREGGRDAPRQVMSGAPAGDKGEEAATVRSVQRGVSGKASPGDCAGDGALRGGHAEEGVGDMRTGEFRRSIVEAERKRSKTANPTSLSPSSLLFDRSRSAPESTSTRSRRVTTPSSNTCRTPTGSSSTTGPLPPAARPTSATSPPCPPAGPA